MFTWAQGSDIERSEGGTAQATPAGEEWGGWGGKGGARGQCRAQRAQGEPWCGVLFCPFNGWTISHDARISKFIGVPWSDTTTPTFQRKSGGWSKMKGKKPHRESTKQTDCKKNSLHVAHRCTTTHTKKTISGRWPAKDGLDILTERRQIIAERLPHMAEMDWPFWHCPGTVGPGVVGLGACPCPDPRKGAFRAGKVGRCQGVRKRGREIPTLRSKRFFFHSWGPLFNLKALGYMNK